MAAKCWKLNFSGVVHSLQLCRSKDLSDLPEIPLPAAIHRLSPANRKPIEASKFPAPPPSTPECQGKISPQTADYSRKRGSKSRAQKIPTNKVNGNGWISGEGETVALFSTSTSFSDDSSFEFAGVKIRSRKRLGCGSNKYGGVNVVSSKTKTAEAPMRSTAERRMVPAEGKVRGSVAVVKKSEDPYEDFRRSMVEMIVEKELFDVEDLEQLLQCFLSLNCRAYHRVIVEAFIEVWEDLFCVYGDFKMDKH